MIQANLKHVASVLKACLDGDKETYAFSVSPLLPNIRDGGACGVVDDDVGLLRYGDWQ